MLCNVQWNRTYMLFNHFSLEWWITSEWHELVGPNLTMWSLMRWSTPAFLQSHKRLEHTHPTLSRLVSNSPAVDGPLSSHNTTSCVPDSRFRSYWEFSALLDYPTWFVHNSVSFTVEPGYLGLTRHGPQIRRSTKLSKRLN